MLQTRANVRLKKRKKTFQKEDVALYLMALPTLFICLFLLCADGWSYNGISGPQYHKGIFKSPLLAGKTLNFFSLPPMHGLSHAIPYVIIWSL